MTEVVTIERLYKDNKKHFKLKAVNPNVGYDRLVTSAHLNRPGFELSGFWDYFDKKRIQILGYKEKRYLKTISEDRLESIFKKLFKYGIPAAVFAHKTRPPKIVVDLANEFNVALFMSPVVTVELGTMLREYLSWHLAPSIIVHGSLVDVYGVGVLFTGRSGIGKSEISLDLVERGHRLVADDVVKLIRRAENVIIGTGLDLLEHHLEVRGLGIVDVNSIFGVRSIREQKRVEVQVELEDWSNVTDYERIGAEDKHINILDVDIPLIKLPIFPGKNITVIAEVIAMNYLLKIGGKNPAKEFSKRLEKKISSKRVQEIIQKYLNKDFE